MIQIMLGMLEIAALSAALPVSVPLPDHRANDAFVFSDGRVEQVREVNGDTVVWSGLSGESYQRSRNFIVPVIAWTSGRGSGHRTIHGNPDLLWPVQANRSGSVRFRVVTETRVNPLARSRRSVNLWSCRTKKARPAEVAAGSFTVIPFQCDRYSASSMRLVERLEWDYSPDVGHYVRRVVVNYLRGTKRSIELVAMLAGPAATKARLRALSLAARR